VVKTKMADHKGPADRVSAAKIFPHSAFSWVDISPNPRYSLSDHPRFASTWSYFYDTFITSLPEIVR
jgi:hypothetical protein